MEASVLKLRSSSHVVAIAYSLGLTSKAKCYCRFATTKYRNFKKRQKGRSCIHRYSSLARRACMPVSVRRRYFLGTAIALRPCDRDCAAAGFIAGIGDHVHFERRDVA
jgi:hypothetical protein